MPEAPFSIPFLLRQKGSVFPRTKKFFDTSAISNRPKNVRIWWNLSAIDDTSEGVFQHRIAFSISSESKLIEKFTKGQPIS